MSDESKTPTELPCDVCGQDGAREMGEGKYCVECYSSLSSSCAGGGTDEPGDLTGA